MIPDGATAPQDQPNCADPGALVGSQPMLNVVEATLATYLLASVPAAA